MVWLAALALVLIALGAFLELSVGPKNYRKSLYIWALRTQTPTRFQYVCLLRGIRHRCFIMAVLSASMLFFFYFLYLAKFPSESLFWQVAIELGGAALVAIVSFFVFRGIDFASMRAGTLTDMYAMLVPGQPLPAELSQSNIQHIASVDGAPNLVQEVLAKIKADSSVSREAEIRSIAHYIWIENGCRSGHDVEHWIEAEAIWENRQKQRQTGSLVAIASLLGLMLALEWKLGTFQLSYGIVAGLVVAMAIGF